MNGPTQQSRIWTGSKTGVVQTMTFCSGEIAVCSQRSPARHSSPNEDSACMVQLDERYGLLAVADGIGGSVNGDLASQSIVQHLANVTRGVQDIDRLPARGLRAEILDAIESANAEILSWKKGAGTTLVAAEFANNQFRTYHAGDSDAILFSNRGRIKFATVGHSPVAQAVDIGMLDEQEALTHEDRNLINNCLGYNDMKIEIGPAVNIARRDTLLLASDGLLDNLSREQIAETIRRGDLQEQAQELVRLSTERMNDPSQQPSKPDDLTLICFRRTA